VALGVSELLGLADFLSGATLGATQEMLLVRLSRAIGWVDHSSFSAASQRCEPVIRSSSRADQHKSWARDLQSQRRQRRAASAHRTEAEHLNGRAKSGIVLRRNLALIRCGRILLNLCSAVHQLMSTSQPGPQSAVALFVLILAVAPARAEEGEAEKLYRAMEKRIRAARSLALEFNSQNTADDKKFTVKGTIHIAAGNKTRLDLESEVFELGGKTLIVTNGKSKYAKVGPMVFREGPFPPEGDVLLALIARFGATAAAMERKIATADLDKDFPVRNFQLGAKEMIGQRETQVVQYQIQNKLVGNLAEMSVWIDTKTQLPLKRAEKETGKENRSTETYSVFTVDGKLDDKLFDIPAK
jgi:outer membrane lipoprotein-sorting protein